MIFRRDTRPRPPAAESTLRPVRIIDPPPDEMPPKPPLSGRNTQYDPCGNGPLPASSSDESGEAS